MDWDYFDVERTVRSSTESVLPMVGRELMATATMLGLIKDMDMASRGRGVKTLLRCSCSSCFDKHNICCKACDINTCFYRCEFLDKEECEYQFLK